MLVLSLLACLHADVHGQEREAQRGLRDVEVVPGCLHGFVGERASGVETAAGRDVLFILIEGGEEMDTVVPPVES